MTQFPTEKLSKLLAPAGSYEAMVAAVRNGADAVYMGAPNFNARRNAKNMDDDELRRAVEFCHLHGVEAHITVNTLLLDRELDEVERLIRTLNEIGVDAVIVCDPAVLRIARAVAPDLPVHASTQITIHSLDGALEAVKMGYSQVILSRELSKTEIAEIVDHCPVKTEMFIHGALCFCYSGQCTMSAVIGRRSGNRGLCAQPCRQKYGAGYPLSLKDSCLAGQIPELIDMGVDMLKIEGRMKRPEYVAVVTGIYRRLLDERRGPTTDEMKTLKTAFSRDGFTDGYFCGRTGADMLGTRPEGRDAEADELYASARSSYSDGALARAIAVDSVFFAKTRMPIRLKFTSADGAEAEVEGGIPQVAKTVGLTAERASDGLSKLGGTPYRMKNFTADIDHNLFLPASELNDLRRRAVEALSEKRIKTSSKRREGEFTGAERITNRVSRKEFTVFATSLSQVSKRMLETAKRVYLPFHTASEFPDEVQKMMAHLAQIAVWVTRVIADRDRETVKNELKSLAALGVKYALVGNIGHIRLVEEAGLIPVGDQGLNVYNSEATTEFAERGLDSLTLACELTLAQMRGISKPVPCEVVAYGRLPLMITKQCIIRNTVGHCACEKPFSLTDRTKAAFPVIPEYGHLNTILNSQPLWMADKLDELWNTGADRARLHFTVESPAECDRIFGEYLSGEAPVGEFTRGLYFRGVE